MKGIIFNAVESAVSELLSEEAWDSMLDAARVDGCYTALGNYDDAELERIVNAAAAATGMTTDEVLRVVGRGAYRFLADRYPDLIDGLSSTVELLHALNEIIHPEVLKLYPEVQPPRFELTRVDDRVIRVCYVSDRGLSALAEGLLHGGADSFGEKLDVTPVSQDGSRTTFDLAVTRPAAV